MLKWTLICITAFERNVLRKIYGLVLVNGQQQNRYNQDIYKLYNEMEQTRNISLRRLQWVGHVMKMKGAQESTERIHRREKTSWKVQREMVRCTGQGC
jgi:hypothetical protein